MNHIPSIDKKICLVTRYNHFDATWRRAWDREFTECGNKFISYRQVQREWFKRSLDLAMKNSADHFMSETTWVTRHFLATDPERLEEIKQLIKEGRYEQLGAGENIVDTNLAQGETIVRNFLLSVLWCENVLGKRPTTGFYRDAFGTSAQMPQIFRQCGFDYITHMDYNCPKKPYWKGLDGSTILFIMHHIFQMEWACVDGHKAMAPCNECHGEGCEICENRGYTLGKLAEFTPHRTPDTSYKDKKGIMYMVGNEENMPGENIESAIKEFNEKYPELYAVQGLYADLRPYILEELSQLDNPPKELVTDSPENNPCITGVYVSRIKMKQLVRKLENMLISIEAKDTLFNKSENHDALKDIWLNVTFYAFHDAITSTCCDQSYYELLDMIAEDTKKAENISNSIDKKLVIPTENKATILNTTFSALNSEITVKGVKGNKQVLYNGEELTVYSTEKDDNLRFCAPNISANATVATVDIREVDNHELKEIDADTISMNGFTLKIGEHGILLVNHEEFGVISPENDSCYFGELILEHDEGDPWSTRNLDKTRERLGQYTQLKSITTNGNETIITYTGKHPSIGVFGLSDPNAIHLKFEQRFIIKKGIPLIYIEHDVDWYTISRRLRLCFKTNTEKNSGLYDIPYGNITRERYEPQDYDFVTPDGDWPAINWAAVKDKDYTFALLNNGTPSYRVEDGMISNSILRSPVSPGGILQPEMYVTNNFATIPDPGHHTFRHAVYVTNKNEIDINNIAQQFNAPPQTILGNSTLNSPITAFVSENSEITAIKRAEKSDDIVLRIVEKTGENSSATLKVSELVKGAKRANILEDVISGLEVVGGEIKIELKPYEIATVILEV